MSSPLWILALALAPLACAAPASGEEVEASEGAFRFGSDDLPHTEVDFGRPASVPAMKADAVFRSELDARRYFGQSCEPGKPVETSICVRPLVDALPSGIFDAPEGRLRAVIFTSRPDVPLGSELVVKKVTRGAVLNMELCTRETASFARSYAMVTVDVAPEEERMLGRVLVRSSELAACD